MTRSSLFPAASLSIRAPQPYQSPPGVLGDGGHTGFSIHSISDARTTTSVPTDSAGYPLDLSASLGEIFQWRQDGLGWELSTELRIAYSGLWGLPVSCIRGLCVLNSKICVLTLIYHFKRRTQLFQVETKHVQEEYTLPHMGKACTWERLTKPHNLSQGPVAPHSPTAEPQVPGEQLSVCSTHCPSKPQQLSRNGKAL